ncbi:tRNA (adenosine(37)-N6)-threonylcarbamoyltransferase complex dimerization subunit type 1 TsaB [Pseudonocardia sp.]|uniref:tRNA (adenosine(37)-N6)-threonylcarbamoyltransferase complex dimerization subunit type 1 TsaB n=1 Tax=Pseudonocardia sp. TaxID=60912 RepID=UPI003D12F15B
MFVLAIDTATSAVVAGIVELTGSGLAVRAEKVAHDTRKHGELLVPGLLAACAEAGITLRDAGAVVVGRGPGPFTGLRVGMVTAAALGDALDVGVYGVCSLDAIACDVPAATGPERFAVITDARRREVYWAVYDGGRRLSGPHVDPPAVAAQEMAELEVAAAAGSVAHVEALGLAFLEPAFPSPAGLVGAAASVLRSGTPPQPLVPLYLRRPDAEVPGERKRVTA